MHKALIISDNQLMATILRKQFQLSDWSCDAKNVPFLTKETSRFSDCTCVVMVVDAEFRNRYSRMIADMGRAYRNVPGKPPVYLLFEDQYKASLDSWLGLTRKVFQQTCNEQKMRDAADEIVKIELGVMDIAACVSPMNSI